MKKPGKRAVTKQLEILNSVEGKGPVDWAVVLVLTSWPDVQSFHDYKQWDTWEECKAVNNTMMWLEGYSRVTPTEYLGYAELPDPPHKLKFVLYAGILTALIGLAGLLLT